MAGAYLPCELVGRTLCKSRLVSKQAVRALVTLVADCRLGPAKKNHFWWPAARRVAGAWLVFISFVKWSVARRAICGFFRTRTPLAFLGSHTATMLRAL